MKTETLKELTRLCDELKELINKSINEQANATGWNGKPLNYRMDYLQGGKNSASIKRKSMDLTRKLADLRQGR